MPRHPLSALMGRLSSAFCLLSSVFCLLSRVFCILSSEDRHASIVRQEPRALVGDRVGGGSRGWSTRTGPAATTVDRRRPAQKSGPWARHNLSRTGRGSPTPFSRTSRRPAASRIWIWDRAAGSTARLGGDRDSGTNVRWSPDSQSLAFTGRADDESGLAIVQRLDGSPAVALARVLTTNHPLPSIGNLLTWSPGSSRVAIANGTPGPEGAEADGDPMVITRYLFKPGAARASLASTTTGGSTSSDGQYR